MPLMSQSLLRIVPVSVIGPADKMRVKGETNGEFDGRELVELMRKIFPLFHKREDTYIARLIYGAVPNSLRYEKAVGYIAGLFPQKEGLTRLNSENVEE